MKIERLDFSSLHSLYNIYVYSSLIFRFEFQTHPNTLSLFIKHSAYILIPIAVYMLCSIPVEYIQFPFISLSITLLNTSDQYAIVHFQYPSNYLFIWQPMQLHYFLIVYTFHYVLVCLFNTVYLSLIIRNLSLVWIQQRGDPEYIIILYLLRVRFWLNWSLKYINRVSGWFWNRNWTFKIILN